MQESAKNFHDPEYHHQNILLKLGSNQNKFIEKTPQSQMSIMHSSDQPLVENVSGSLLACARTHAYVHEKYDMRARADWAALKPSTPFGQLPFMNIDGSAPIAQSGAMCVFLWQRESIRYRSLRLRP